MQRWEQQFVEICRVTIRGGPLYPLIGLIPVPLLLLLGALLISPAFTIPGRVGVDLFTVTYGGLVLVLGLLLMGLQLFMVLSPSTLQVDAHGVTLDNGARVPWQEIARVTTSRWILDTGVSFILTPAGDHMAKRSKPARGWRRLLNPLSTAATYPISLTIGPPRELCAWLQLMHQRHLGLAPWPGQ